MIVSLLALYFTYISLYSLIGKVRPLACFLTALLTGAVFVFSLIYKNEIEYWDYYYLLMQSRYSSEFSSFLFLNIDLISLFITIYVTGLGLISFDIHGKEKRKIELENFICDMTKNMAALLIDLMCMKIIHVE